MPQKPPSHQPMSRKSSDAAYEAKRKLDPALRRAAKLNRSARWRRFRERFLKVYPLCCDPFKTHATEGVTVVADHVHHVQPLRVRPDLAFNRSNCRALCTKCHGRVCAMERKGAAATELFPPVADDADRYTLL